MNEVPNKMMLNHFQGSTVGNVYLYHVNKEVKSELVKKFTTSEAELNSILGGDRCLINININGIAVSSTTSNWAGHEINELIMKNKPIWSFVTEDPIKQESIKSGWQKWIKTGGNPMRFWLSSKMAVSGKLPVEIRMIPHSKAIENGHTFWILLIDLSKEWSYREHCRAEIRSTRNKREQAYLDFASWLHDWKAPLCTIESSTWLCLRYKSELDAEKRDRHLRRIEKAVHEMKTGMQDWQTWHQPPSLRTISKIGIWSLIKDRIQQISPVLKTGQKILMFHQGSSEINTDPTALSHVLDNLLANASKFSPDHTSIWVRGWNSKGILRIDVSDEGIGIPKSEINQLFEPRYRASNASDTPGNGLGLSTVHRLIKQLGGDIQVISEINEGTTFTISLKNQQQSHEKSTDHRRQFRNPIQHR